MNSLNVDGVIVDCWWGIVEGWNPQKYVWSGYRELFNIIQEFKMKIQVDFNLIELHLSLCLSVWSGCRCLTLFES